MSVTIKDIAKRAGVSFSTVSKALRDSPLVQERTKRRILELARELGYQPNIAARQLVSRRSGVIGVVWPSLERTAPSALITRVNAELEGAGYTTLLSLNRMESAIETFRRLQVDAMLLFYDRPGSNEPLPSSNVPILCYGSAGSAPWSTLDVNRPQAIRLAVRHLQSLGHRTIAYIGDPEREDPLQAVKVAAFRAETGGEGIVVRVRGLESHDGYEAGKRLLDEAGDRRPTAVVSGSFDLTRGLLRVVAELRLAVPDELSIVSYDHIPQMAELDVPMTVVGVDITDIAAAIARSLLGLVDDPRHEAAVTLQPELVERASTARARVPRADA